MEKEEDRKETRKREWGEGGGEGKLRDKLLFVSGKQRERKRAVPVEATAEWGKTKYGPHNKKGVRLEGEQLNQEEWSELEELYSYGLAKGTWSSYNTAAGLLAKCCEEKGLKKELPVEEGTVLAFIHWLAYKRGNKATTIDTYLSGIRQLHVERGLPTDSIRTERVTTIIKGLKNKNLAEDRKNKIEKRKPITTDILTTLKKRLSESELAGRDQRLVWTVSSLLFHGAFRIHELLCKVSGSFDPDFTLLGEDVKLVRKGGEEVLQIKIKAPKEDKAGKSIIVDVFETGTELCPIRAYKKWSKFRVESKEQPMFRLGSGIPLTGKKFNEIVRRCLKGEVEGMEGLLSSHSFRAGTASMMAAIGYSDEEIKAVGRWSSRAFMEYIKLPRTQRAEIARRIGKST